MMIWVFIFMELLAFGLAFVVFAALRARSLAVFESSQAELNQALALFNTVVGFYNASAQGPRVAYLVLAIGLVKFFLIFFDFMEMKHAHRVWQASMTLFTLVLFAAISISF